MMDKWDKMAAADAAERADDELEKRIARAVAAERERCARIVEEYNPGGSYNIRTLLAAAIRRA